jgi:hypothetical protein
VVAILEVTKMDESAKSTSTDKEAEIERQQQIIELLESMNNTLKEIRDTLALHWG